VSTAAPISEIVAQGSWGTVECVVLATGRVPAKEFLSGLDAKTQAPLMVLFQNMANSGSLSPKRFKKEMGNLSAFRHEIGRRQFRFPCFRDGNRWTITHGFIKPGAKNKLGKWPQAEVTRAKNIEAEYWARKALASRE
jgi:Phage derived protein Gp49-like (DUF891)